MTELDAATAEETMRMGGAGICVCRRDPINQ